MNVRPEIIKLLEENVGSNLFDTGPSNIFLDMSPQARETKAKINRTISKWKAFTQQRKLYQQNKEAAYWIGEDICKWYIQ